MTDREVITEGVSNGVKAALEPLVTVWDARSRDMLDVLRDAEDARQQIRRAAAVVKLAAWTIIVTMIAGAASVWILLAAERRDRMAFREAEQQRRRAAVGDIVEQVRLEVRRNCGKPER